MERKFVEQLLGATSVPDMTAFSTDLQKSKVKVKWLPVGNKDNNLATINLGSDSAAGLIERVTNAIDAVIDREWIQQGCPEGFRTPRSATSAWFAVPEGHLGSVPKEDLKQFEELSKRVVVTLQDSNNAEYPTVDIRDKGIGLLPSEFGDSILSLNNSRKLKKLFLSGAFGQGGSTALAYSPYTIIFSRKAAVGKDMAGPLGFTVVRYNAGNTEQDKHGLYEYMVDPKTLKPFFIDCEDEWFEPGTLVRHVHMKVQKYASVMTSPTGSLWWLAHNYLFDPVMPFRIEENRKSKVKDATGRMVTGNNRRLTQGDSVEYRNSVHLHFREGRVDIHWWVLSADDEAARERIKNYAMISKPIVVTFNGQKQGDFPNTVIKDEVKLPFLDRYLIVQVDCDRLDGESRRELFPTTRETIRDSQIGDDLRRLIVEALAGDEKLRELDHKRKQRYMKSPSAPDDAIRKRLAKRIKSSMFTGGGKEGPRTAPPESTHDYQEPAAIPVVDPPSFLKITSASPRKVYAGRTFTIKFETDARPDYFASLDHFIAIVNPPTFGTFQGLANVRGGHGVAYFRAMEDVEIGATASVTLEVRPPRAASLSDSLDLEAIELPQTTGAEKGDARTPNLRIVRVTKDEPFYSDHDWDGKSVALVESDDESTNVFISVSNERLTSLVARAQRKDESAVQSVLDFYVEHVAFYAVIDSLSSQAQPRRIEAEENDDDHRKKVREDIALINACDTVCGIMEALFDVLVVGALETA
ncbi:hypothetical protein ACFQZQ_12530 [Lysobacter koreensis]|uniref:Uncharacterized protein n=1 Tax=Lysobacter koreensis TaxID=266122 RepID=A0ABW2YQ07_9GAMM